MPAEDIKYGVSGYDHIAYVINYKNASYPFRASSSPCSFEYKILRRYYK
jgi:hypothetical protein